MPICPPGYWCNGSSCTLLLDVLCVMKWDFSAKIFSTENFDWYIGQKNCSQKIPSCISVFDFSALYTNK